MAVAPRKIVGIRGDPWSRCDRCGCDYRLSELSMQNGQLLCRSDFDNPEAFHRDETIAQVISSSPDEMRNVTAEKRSESAQEDYS